MAGVRFEKLAEVFEHARELEPDARPAYLDQACGDEPELRAQVLALLDQHDRGGVLDHPIGPTELPHEPVPERVGHFRILEPLGRGGMGVVYRAEQDQPKRQVAIKIMHAGLVSEQMRRRFEFETAVLARLQHPGIAQIYEVGTFKSGGPPRPFFAMELVAGVALDRFVSDSNPSIERRLRLFVSVCEAVEHAHQKGVIHRDLKPANILVTPDGTPKVLDFGVARATDADLQVTLYTTPGQLIGTLAYMSPEQVNAATDRLDTRSDVYALGVLLYEALSGQLPYELHEGKIASAIRVIEECEPRSLTLVSRTLRGDLDTIVRKALRKRPEDRYQSASELAADINRFLNHEPISARPAAAWYQLSRFARRHRGMVAGVAIALIAVVAGAGAVLWQASRTRAEAETRRHVAGFLKEILTSIEPAKTGGDPLTVREMLDDAAGRIDDRFEQVPAVRGELHRTIGSTYYLLGEYEEAERHARAAWQDLEQATGSRSDDTLLAMATLGLALAQQDRLDEAESILRDAQRRALRADKPIVSTIDEDLAITLDLRDRDVEAERLFRSVYRDTLARLGPEHADTLRAQNNLGKVLMDLRRYEEALPLLEACRRLRGLVLGDDHPDTITTTANLGAVLYNLGRLDEGVIHIRDAAERSERVLGPIHLSTLRRHQNLLRSELQAGDFARAVPHARDLLARSERTLGETHRDTMAALELTVMIVGLSGDLAGAEALALEWHARLEREYGAQHAVTGRVAYLVYNVYDEMGDTEKTELWRQRVEASDFEPKPGP